MQTLLLLLWALPLVSAVQADPNAGRVPFQRIDAHAHVCPPPDSFFQMLERLDVRLLNVTLVDPHAPGFDTTEPQTSWAIDVSDRSRGRVAWASTFDPRGFASPDFVEQTSRQLLGTFARGAVAVKVYKSIGMDLKSESGKYIMPDDPAFGPVFELMAREDRTLLAHLAEPRSSWRPLDPADPHYGYYKANPDWHMFLHPEKPTWESIIAARDHVLESHPKLRVVGCHLGSMEHDVDEVARRLDRYPNFAVDTAARMTDLMLQPRDKVRSFLIRYQDRVLWGTDLMELRWEDPDVVLKRWEAVYARDWKFLATDDVIDLNGRRVRGLALPEAVLRKIFRENALRWIPGMQSPGSLPTPGQVIAAYVEALGGEDALRKVTSRGARGSIVVPTFGSYGTYEELAQAPNRLIRRFTVPRYGVIQRCFDGKTGWVEDPEYGVEELAGARLAEICRDAEFQPALTLQNRYSKLEVTSRTTLDQIEVFEMTGTSASGTDTMWFDAKTGLLAAVESVETARDGTSRRVRMYHEDYRVVDGVKVPHILRYESREFIWIVRRGVSHNIPVKASIFEKP